MENQAVFTKILKTLLYYIAKSMRHILTLRLCNSSGCIFFSGLGLLRGVEIVVHNEIFRNVNVPLLRQNLLLVPYELASCHVLVIAMAFINDAVGFRAMQNHFLSLSNINMFYPRKWRFRNTYSKIKPPSLPSPIYVDIFPSKC